MQPLSKNTSWQIIGSPTINVGRLFIRKIKNLLSRLNKTISSIFLDTHANPSQLPEKPFDDMKKRITMIEGRLAIAEQTRDSLRKEKRELEAIIDVFLVVKKQNVER